MTDASNFQNLLFHGNTHVIERFSTSFPMHWHNYIEIISIPLNNKKENIYEVNSNSNLTEESNINNHKASYLYVNVNHSTYLLKEGDILMIWPGELHEIVSGNGENILGVQFAPSILNERPEFSSHYNSFRKHHHIRESAFQDTAEEMRTCLNKIAKYNKSYDYYKGVNIIISLYKCFLSFAHYVQMIDSMNFIISSVINNETISKINSACNYINDNCSHNLTLDFVASHTGFSSYYFSRIFKQITSSSFVEYVTNQRIRLAQQLLSDSSYTITEIAYLAGFRSIATFNRVFKKHKGYSPREFRSFYAQE